ncbi:MAG: amidohydrolase family protein [Gemmatimonadetes bacterium]|nr:amidohydrolase family protein [Gemmatimonadota bacterium]
MSKKVTRKDFLGMSALLAGAAATPPIAAAAMNRTSHALPAMPQKGNGIDADLIVINGRVLTSDPSRPRAEAFAVKDGRFLAVGSNADIANLRSARTKVIDAARMTVTPGFIDAHNHPGGVNELFEVNGNLRSIAELKAAITKKAAQTPPGQW